MIEKLKQETQRHKAELLNNLQYDDPLLLLFDLSVYFEKHCGDQSAGSHLQAAGTWLSKLIRKVFKEKKLKWIPLTEEEAHEKILKRLVQLHEKGFEASLEALCNIYAHLEKLDDLIQIQCHDENCVVQEYEAGCFITRVAAGRFDQFQNYIRSGLKLEEITEYYFNKGRYTAFDLVSTKTIELKGANEDHRADSFDQLAFQIATRDFLEHYGVEDIFTLNGNTYQTGLLIQILNLLIVYSQSRYGMYWEEAAQEANTIKRICRVWQSNIQNGGNICPGPLFIDSRASFIARISSTIPGHTKSEIERHVDFFRSNLDGPIGHFNLFERPLLQMGDLMLFFARPLLHQNGWLPILFPLIKPKGKVQPAGANDRVTSSTQYLAQKFRKHDFYVQTEVDLIVPVVNKKVTDVDVIALKDDYLILLQIKMTHPRSSLQEIKSYKKTLQKAGGQLTQSVDYLCQYWNTFRSKLGSDKEWSDLKIIPLVVSTSLEYDRELFSGYPKISQFELERYLDNDAYLLHSDPEKALNEPGWEAEHLFYPSEQKLSGQLLMELISANTLWNFLELGVLAKSIEAYLPSGCLKDSDAQLAEDCFEKGNEHYQQNDFVQAEKYFRKAIAFFPHQEAYYKGLGNALVMQEKREASLEFFDKAIEINTNYGEGYNARGLTYQELGLYDKAYPDFQKAIQHSPYDITSWGNTARLLISLGKNFKLNHLFLEGKHCATKGLFIFARLPEEQQNNYSKEAEALVILSSL